MIKYYVSFSHLIWKVLWAVMSERVSLRGETLLYIWLLTSVEWL